MRAISNIDAEEILDSRGTPTLKTTVFLEDDSQGSFSVPSGASTGRNEALELRDGDQKRHQGMGVLKAIENIRGPILATVKGLDAQKQRNLDETLINLDGTENKSRLGANALLSVSVASAVSASASSKTPLFKYLHSILESSSGESYQVPIPMISLIEGGKHASGGLQFQEFLVAPRNYTTFKGIFQAVKNLMKELENLLEEKNINHKIGMEGGYDLSLTDNEEAIKILKEAIDRSGEGFDVGLDIAATSFYKNSYYKIKNPENNFGTDGFVNYLVAVTKKYNLFSLEDPLQEEDWSGWEKITEKLSHDTIIVADDLATTNMKRLTRIVTEKSANGVIAKPNQIGTLTETLDFIQKAKESGLKIVLSHRGRETLDTFIADLSVAVSADFIKIGSPSQKERLTKFNRLLEIEKYLDRGKADA